MVLYNQTTLMSKNSNNNVAQYERGTSSLMEHRHSDSMFHADGPQWSDRRKLYPENRHMDLNSFSALAK